MKFLNNKIITASFGVLLLFASQSPLASPPRVLATIKPLQLLAQGITEGVSSTEVLLPPGASPHNHSLRPSDAARLHSADVIFWVGPSMESFLTRILPESSNVKTLAMVDIKGIRLRNNGSKETDSDHPDDHEHDHGNFDPHLWLSTDNGRVMAQAMAATLKKLDKDNAAKYQDNLTRLLKTLDEADRHNNRQLADIQEKPFFVFHDAYGYLQDQYHLNIAGHFTLNPEMPPGARHLSELRSKLKITGRTCIFREPQFQPAYIDRITEGLTVKIGILDPMAGNIEVSSKGFSQFISSLVDNISVCMTQ